MNANKLMTPTNVINKRLWEFYIFWRYDLKKYFYISIGGALGAALRYAISINHIWIYNENIHFNTLIINVTGCFILALFLTVAFEVMEIDADIRLGVSTGFLGAFTTFSTLCNETVELIADNEYFAAMIYVTASTILGLAAAYFGVVLARKSINKLSSDANKNKKSNTNCEGEVE